MSAARPNPPEELVGSPIDAFLPSDEMAEWIGATFIGEGAPLENPDHAHLQEASIGFLWTSCANVRAMRMVLGQTEIMPPMAMGKWQRARAVAQIEAWFDGMPDFLITIDANAAAMMDDTAFCALVEHELYHCGQERDAYGAPKFTQDGRPKFGIRGHDVEEFTGVVRRYGAGAAKVSEFVEAALGQPEIGYAEIEGVCGTCGLKAA